MKKETKKLTLNKKIISNLNAGEMTKQVGGGTAPIYGCSWGCGNPQKTKNGKTCPGHNTCYTC